MSTRYKKDIDKVKQDIQLKNEFINNIGGQQNIEEDLIVKKAM